MENQEKQRQERLFDRHALGEVFRLVDVAVSADGYMVGEEKGPLGRERTPAAKAGVVVRVDVRAEAQTYLRSKGKNGREAGSSLWLGMTARKAKAKTEADSPPGNGRPREAKAKAEAGSPPGNGKPREARAKAEAEADSPPGNGKLREAKARAPTPAVTRRSRSWRGFSAGRRRSLGGRLCGRRGVGGGLLPGWGGGARGWGGCG
jgi:hypothetical protein